MTVSCGKTDGDNRRRQAQSIELDLQEIKPVLYRPVCADTAQAEMCRPERFDEQTTYRWGSRAVVLANRLRAGHF